MNDSQKPVPIKVSRLIELDEEQGYPIGFEVLAGAEGLSNEISSEEIDRPGLPLAGYFEEFAPHRIQILGKGEMAFIQKLIISKKLKNIKSFLNYNIPVCVVTYDLDVPGFIIDCCNEKGNI